MRRAHNFRRQQKNRQHDDGRTGAQPEKAAQFRQFVFQTSIFMRQRDAARDDTAQAEIEEAEIADQPPHHAERAEPLDAGMRGNRRHRDQGYQHRQDIAEQVEDEKAPDDHSFPNSAAKTRPRLPAKVWR